MNRILFVKALLGIMLVFNFLAVNAQSTSAAGTGPSSPILTIDTPVLLLLQKPGTRAVLEKNLPNLVRAMEDDFDVRQMLGDSSLKELSIDDAHVKNFDEELLEKLRMELAQAQQS